MEETVPAKEAFDLRWGARMVFIDNLLRPVEPLLVLACAGIYAGGQWGTFKFAESLVYLLFRLSLMGLDRGLIWWYGQANAARYRKDLISAMGMVVASSMVGFLAMLVMSRTAFLSVRGMDLKWLELLFLAGSIPLLALSEVVFQTNLNHKEMLGKIIGKNIVLPLVVFGGGLIGHFSGSSLGLPFWFFLGNLANAAVAIFVFVKVHRAAATSFGRPGIPPRELWRFSLPIMGSDLMAGLIGRVDLMMLGALADIRAVEIYNVIMMIGRSLMAIRQSFEGILLSAFSRDGARRLTNALRQRMNHTIWMIGNLIGLLFIVLVFWGAPLLELVHAEYRTGYVGVVMLAFFTYLNVFGDLSGVMLQGLGNSRSWMLAQIAGFGVNVGCNFWWIPVWGATGGVLAYCASFLVQGAVCLILLWRGSGMVPWLGAYVRSSGRFCLLLVGIGGVSAWFPDEKIRPFLFVASISAWALAFWWRARDFKSRAAGHEGGAGSDLPGGTAPRAV
ncbi:MAG: hypothetical protein RL173_673 [Fibrobacterota bacterium]|jgi:O-antigen/teichoic acid export membrane protein